VKIKVRVPERDPGKVARQSKRASTFVLALASLVRLAGFEPTTPWFVAKYSIQLSYSRCKPASITCFLKFSPLKADHFCQPCQSLATDKTVTPGRASIKTETRRSTGSQLRPVALVVEQATGFLLLQALALSREGFFFFTDQHLRTGFVFFQEPATGAGSSKRWRGWQDSNPRPLGS
jgi:hypothetical protein